MIISQDFVPEAVLNGYAENRPGWPVLMSIE
jgi:hypothetical protein